MAETEILRRGVVAVIQRGEQLLVIRRSQMVLAPGMYCFPGGGIEGDESEALALVRELQEELSLPVRPRRRLWQSVTPWRIALAWWSVEFDPEHQPRPNPAEVESVHWYSPSEMLALPNLLESNAEFLRRLLAGEIRLE